MQGIYIHIPFCSQACHYCDFHFSTNLNNTANMADAISREIDFRHKYLNEKTIDTIYFGGGTPTVLSIKEIEKILYTISKYYTISKNTEITIEANPDDLSKGKMIDLKVLGFNRLSIGIQSFNNSHLNYLNRIHSACNAEYSVKQAQDIGFSNISIDLIYGIPASDHLIWLNDIQKAITLHVPHISSYCLTIESNTVFGKWVKSNKIKNIDEEFAAAQFEILMDTMDANSYEHYEISNFCKPGMYSRHNSNYWSGAHYLGVGPAAHSFNGISRQYNISNNSTYLRSLKDNTIPFEKEILSKQDQINEYIMTSIRTAWGCNIKNLEKNFNIDLSFYESVIHKYQRDDYLVYKAGIVYLTRKGKLIADKITSDLFIVTPQ